MRARHFLFALILFAASQTAAAAAAPTSDMTDGLTDGGGGAAATGGCEVAYVAKEVVGAPDYSAPVPAPVAAPAPLEVTKELALDEQSYVDVYSILRSENECSRFFGGPAQAVEAFNELARSLKRKRLGSRTLSVRMTGGYAMYRNHRTGATYRLFADAAVNTDGPLFRKFAAHDRDKVVRRIGSFLAETRAAKALTFLHELGHVVARAGGEWVLPNDGNNQAMSERNTKTVEENCGTQLTALGE